MKIAVTGGMGFIGHELVDRLLRDGHEVTVVDYAEKLIRSYEATRLPIMRELYRILPKCHIMEPEDFVWRLGSGYDVVVHAGAVVDTKDLGSSTLMETNVRYTEQLAEKCAKIGTRIVFISSAAVYGSEGFPNNPYGLTKALGERIVLNMSPRAVVLRLFNVFGRFEHHKGEMASVPWKIARAFVTGEKFRLHSPHGQRDFVPSSAVVEAIVHTVKEVTGTPGPRNYVYDVGTGSPTHFSTLADMIASSKEWGSAPLPIENVEIPSELAGRYQMYTCAGTNDAPIINAGIRFKSLSTAQGILEAYGVDR